MNDGTTLVEYALICALIIVACMSGLKYLRMAIDNKWNTVSDIVVTNMN